MKIAFRKKNMTQPYMHKELEKTPFQKLDDDTKVMFDLDRLAPT